MDCAVIIPNARHAWPEAGTNGRAFGGTALFPDPMRKRNSLKTGPLGVVVLTVFCLATSPVSAQSLLQSFFGGLFSAKPKTERQPRYEPVPMSLHRLPGPSFYDDRPERKTHSGHSWGSGAYRTVCVRTCDGYYFPISEAASRSQFRRDADACNARCGGRLYYLPNYSADTAAMVDLTGRRYDQLETAFVYRKKLINGCSCRPMPWSAAERARHRRYEYEAEIAKLNAHRERAVQARSHAIRAGEASPADEVRTSPPAAPVVLAGHGVAETPILPAAIDQLPSDLSELGPDGLPLASPPPRPDRSQPRPRANRKAARKRKGTTGWSPFAGASTKSKYSWPGDR